jgi:hypothetical protein
VADEIARDAPVHQPPERPVATGTNDQKIDAIAETRQLLARSSVYRLGLDALEPAQLFLGTRDELLSRLRPVGRGPRGVVTSGGAGAPERFAGGPPTRPRAAQRDPAVIDERANLIDARTFMENPVERP